jgi:Mg/Co/Ni transporter MgtE
MGMSRSIYVIGNQETVIAGTVLLRIVIFEKHTTPIQGVITSDLSVVNIFSFYFFYLQDFFVKLREF